MMVESSKLLSPGGRKGGTQLTLLENYDQISIATEIATNFCCFK